jgi:hypothetical protein
MTAIKFLSAGLIAVAMLATPVMARGDYAAHRYLTEGANASAAVHHFEAHVGIPAPRGDGVSIAPSDEQGDACDVGDTPHIC